MRSSRPIAWPLLPSPTVPSVRAKELLYGCVRDCVHECPSAEKACPDTVKPPAGGLTSFVLYTWYSTARWTIGRDLGSGVGWGGVGRGGVGGQSRTVKGATGGPTAPVPLRAAPRTVPVAARVHPEERVLIRPCDASRARDRRHERPRACVCRRAVQRAGPAHKEPRRIRVQKGRGATRGWGGGCTVTPVHRMLCASSPPRDISMGCHLPQRTCCTTAARVSQASRVPPG